MNRYDLKLFIMKKCAFLLISMSVANISLAQWTSLNPLPQSHLLSSVYFTDANTGYAAGDSGTILKTSNAGTSWAALSSGTTNNLFSIQFPNVNTGYAVGNLGTILKTNDGGTIWSALSGVNTYSHNSVSFINNDIGYAGGENFNIIKTINGGASWTDLGPFDIVSGYLSSVYFTDINTGYRASGYVNMGAIEKTTDGGTTWTTSVFIDIGELYSVYFTDADTGYAVGGDFWTERNSVILKTMNGGADWTIQNLADSHILRSVYFTDANTGYAVGDSGTILRTSNGGTDWTIQNSGTSSNLTSVFFTDANTGYAVGDSGVILKTTNGGGSTTGIANQTQIVNSLKIYPNPASDKITVEISSNPSKSELSILNINGQELITGQITESRTQLDISNLSEGVYFVRLTGEKTVQLGKFVKQFEK
jgi:photosystem II stability/assembly factor-like uncharacterized protein